MTTISCFEDKNLKMAIAAILGEYFMENGFELFTDDYNGSTQLTIVHKIKYVPAFSDKDIAAILDRYNISYHDMDMDTQSNTVTITFILE